MMMNLVEFTDWRFPNQRNRYKGNLDLNSNNEGKLQLYGDAHLELDFESYQKSLTSDSTQSYMHILGETNTSPKNFITVKGLKKSIIGFQCVLLEFDVKFFIMGAQINSWEKLKLDEITVEYSNLDNWIDTHKFSSEMQGRIFSEWESDTKHAAHFSLGKTIEIEIDLESLIRIVKLPKIKRDFVSPPETSHIIYVKFISKNRPLDYFIDLANRFRDLLNFFIIDFDVNMNHVYGHLTIQQEEGPYKPISIHFPFHFVDNFVKIDIVSPYLLEGLLEKDFINLISNWLKLREEFPSTYDLFFGVMYNRYINLQTQFLNLFSALEIYTSIRFRKKYPQKIEEKENRIKKICEFIDKSNLPIDDMRWLKNIVSDKKAFSLNERLKMIYQEYISVLSQLSDKMNSDSSFTVNTALRSRLTHGNVEYEELDIPNLFWRSKDIQLVLYLCILSELNFSIEDIKKIYMI